MIQLRTVNKRIREEISPYMELVKGKGYFYLVFDESVDETIRHPRYESYTIPVYSLNQQKLERWIDDALDFKDWIVNR